MAANGDSGKLRVLVLGHSGFIGGHLLAALGGDPLVASVAGVSLPGCDLTVRKHVEALRSRFLPGSVLIVCAAKKRQLGDDLEAFEQNVMMIANLCRVLKELPPLAKVIFFSSAAVYGEENHDVSITEETAIRPTSYYGAAKFAGECLLRKTLEPGTPVIALRPALVYGPGDGAMYGPSGFIRSALAEDGIALWGDGSERREFVYVEDVAKLVQACVGSDFRGVLNVVNGRSDTFRELVREVGILRPGIEVSERPRSKPKVDHAFDNSRLRELFPTWSPTPLTEGVRRTWQAAKEASR